MEMVPDFKSYGDQTVAWLIMVAGSFTLLHVLTLEIEPPGLQELQAFKL